jgi:Sigma-70 region 2
MDQQEWLARRFEDHRPHLRAVAYRMLGSLSEADDAVQEAWLRLSHANTAEVENLGGWLTTVVARVALNMLRHATRAASSRSRCTCPIRSSTQLRAAIPSSRRCSRTRSIALLSPRLLSNRVDITTFPQGVVPVQSRDLIFDNRPPQRTRAYPPRSDAVSCRPHRAPGMSGSR